MTRSASSESRLGRSSSPSLLLFCSRRSLLNQPPNRASLEARQLLLISPSPLRQHSTQARGRFSASSGGSCEQPGGRRRGRALSVKHQLEPALAFRFSGNPSNFSICIPDFHAQCAARKQSLPPITNEEEASERRRSKVWLHVCRNKWHECCVHDVQTKFIVQKGERTTSMKKTLK